MSDESHREHYVRHLGEKALIGNGLRVLPDIAGCPTYGLKGSLNEYELDLLRQRSLSARYEKARRGALVVGAPVGFVKASGRLEKDPDRRVQEAIRLVFDKVEVLFGAGV